MEVFSKKEIERKTEEGREREERLSTREIERKTEKQGKKELK